MNAVRQRLSLPGPVILDGGLATELEGMGHDLRDRLWSAKLLLDDPAAIEAVHRSYVEAGSDIITTATYQATFEGLARRGLDEAAATELLERAVSLARRACEGTDVLVAGSVGPYGAFLADGSEYRGRYGIDVQALTRFHRRRIEVLAPEVDVLAIETVPCLDEARALAVVLADLPEATAWVSFSCSDAAHVSSGDPIEACIEAVADLPAVVAVGVNCFAPMHGRALVERIRSTTDKPIVVYPNAGERYADGAWTGPATDPERFVALARTWVDAGAKIVGGCCRTGPLHIARLSAALRGK
jgi:homocysteine S-methyltransferase